MRVPLEILRLILAYFDRRQAYIANFNREAWLADLHDKLALRLVSRKEFSVSIISFTKTHAELFDHEILAITTFPYDFPFKPSTWYRTPPRFREMYMMHHIKAHPQYHGAFSYTVVPVFERHLARLGISPDDSEAREDKMREWCNLLGHHVWDLGWTLDKSVGCCRCCPPKISQGLGDYVSRQIRWFRGDGELWGRRGLSEFRYIRHDDRFLRIMYMIVKGDVAGMESEGYWAVDQVNIACGHTFLGLGIEKASVEMVRVLLRETKTVTRLHLYVYLRLALKREQAQTFVNTLLDAVSGADKKRFAIGLFEKAISNSDIPLFDAVIGWMTTVRRWEGKQKLEVIEWCFKRVLDVRERKKRRHRNLDWIRRRGICVWLAPVDPRSFLAYPAPLPSRTADTDSAREKDVEEKKEDSLQPHRPLLRAFSLGLHNWVDWMLWAGADPSHVSGTRGTLDWTGNTLKRLEWI
jgi:hypothetical protein